MYIKEVCTECFFMISYIFPQHKYQHPGNHYKSTLMQCHTIQLMPALKVNIIIVHPRGVVFPGVLARGKKASQGWTIMMFTLSAGNNCFIILKLYFFASLLFRLINANISVNEQPEWFHWAHRRWDHMAQMQYVIEFPVQSSIHIIILQYLFSIENQE
jgi:hypothetical protein